MKTRKTAEQGESEAKPDAPSGVSERILHVLGMTTRPLNSRELAKALALPAQESGDACRWLVERGYIHSTVPGARDATAEWSLARKG